MFSSICMSRNGAAAPKHHSLISALSEPNGDNGRAIFSISLSLDLFLSLTSSLVC